LINKNKKKRNLPFRVSDRVNFASCTCSLNEQTKAINFNRCMPPSLFVYPSSSPTGKLFLPSLHSKQTKKEVAPIPLAKSTLRTALKTREKLHPLKPAPLTPCVVLNILIRKPNALGPYSPAPDFAALNGEARG
jgi:hypothetical protein